jgi:MoxR-like ATPase
MLQTNQLYPIIHFSLINGATKMAKKEIQHEEFTEVAPKAAMECVESAMAANRALFIWGSPGIGKSELIDQIAKKQNRLVIDMRLILMGPEDLKGIPYFDSNDGTMRWAPSSELPVITTEADVQSALEIMETFQEAYNSILSKKDTYEDMLKYAVDLAEAKNLFDQSKAKYNRFFGALAYQNAILFLDEMNSAPPSVQGAAYQLTLNRRIGEYVLPDGISIVAAGNRDSDKGVTYRMPTPLANRLIHIHMNVSFDDWQDWAIKNSIHPDVVGFLSAHPSKLHNFNPKSADKAFATPRSWVFVSDLLKRDMKVETARVLIGGTIGEGLAIEFMQHRKISADLPAPKDVLEGKIKTLKIDEISTRYTLTISLCYLLREYFDKSKDSSDEMTHEEFMVAYDNYMTFLMDCMQDELVILGITTALRRYELPIDRSKSKSFSRLYDNYGKMVLSA